MKTRLHLLLAATALFSIPALAQIPNAGFENWYQVGSYQDPVGWVSSNEGTTAEGAGLSCEKGTPGAVGSSYAKLTSRTVTAIGVIPGQLVSDANDMDGFPYAARPAALNGQWKYAVQPNDAGVIIVTLTKFNASTQEDDAVGFGLVNVEGSQANWQNFSVPITYSSADTPDKALIIIMSSFFAGVEGSTLSVDDLGFGNATGIDETASLPELTIRPTLTTDLLTVITATPMAEISVMDMTGRSVKAVSVGQAEVEVQVSDLPAGRYFLSVRMNDGRRNIRSFVKQ